MNPSRGDIVLIVMPGELGKPRPAVIVQADEIGARRTIVVCPMSSDLAETSTLRPQVDPIVANGLRVRSQIMTDKITAVRRDRVRRTIGTLGASEREALNRALLIVLGLGQQTAGGGAA